MMPDNQAQPTSPPPSQPPVPDRFESVSEDISFEPVDESINADEMAGDGGERETLEQDQAFAKQPDTVVEEAVDTPAAEPVKRGFIRSGTPEPLASKPEPKHFNEPAYEQPETTTETGMAVAGNQNLGLSQTNDPGSLMRWGNIIFESKAFPLLKSPQEAVVRILMARTLKIDEMMAMYMLHVIDSKPVLSADLTRFLLDRANVRYTVLEDHALYVNPSTQQNDFLTRIRMTHEATKKNVTWDLWYSECAPYIKTNGATWGKFSRMMHLHATVRQCARFYFPAILGGMYDAEELDLDEGKTFAKVE